jgi:hypothetical protein
MRKPSSFWQFSHLLRSMRRPRRSNQPSASRLHCEHLETRNLLAADGWFNIDLPADVNADGLVTPMDALLVANVVYENSGSSVTLTADNPGSIYPDVNNDGQIGEADFTEIANQVGGGSGSDAGSGNALQANEATTPVAAVGVGAATMMMSMTASGSGGGGGAGSASVPASTCANTVGWRDARGQIAVYGSYRAESEGASFYFERYGLTSVGCGVRITYHTEDGSARSSGSGVGEPDYTAVTGSVDFTPDKILATVGVGVVGDDIVEPNESILLVIDSITPINGTVMQGLTVFYPPDYSTYPPNISPGAGKATITNDDTAEVSLSVAYVDAAGNPTDNKEGAAGTTKKARVTATLSKPVVGSVSVSYSAMEFGAKTSDGDYGLSGSSLTIPGAVRDPVSGTWVGGSASFDVTINGDDKVELDESLHINFSNLDAGGLPVQFATYVDAQGVTQQADSVYILIANDDQATVSFKRTTEKEIEENGAIVFTLKLNQAVDVPVTVDFASIAGSALPGIDYESAAGSHVTFAGGAGEEQTLSVTIIDDEIVEAHEDFTVQIANVHASGRAVAGGGSATGTIQNMEVAMATIVDSHWFSLNWELERDTMNTPYKFHVKLSKQVDAPVTVYYETDDIANEAEAGKDYVAKSGSVVIPAYTFGVDNAVSIMIIGDTIDEYQESFKVKLVDDDDGGGGGREVNSLGSEATGNIQDDD